MGNLWFSGIFVLIVAGVVIYLAATTSLLRDRLIPQLSSNKQTFSLARTQMAWWFIVVLGSYLFLWARGFDPLNSLTNQVAVLLGISLATAGGGAAVDNIQDTPEDAVNDALKQLGLTNYDDVKALQADIAVLVKTPNPTPAQVADLNNKQNILKTYEDKTKPFETQDFFHDLVTDVDGITLHRLQALVWTVVFGAVFVWKVATSHSMPTFDDGMLALMGISGAGYVGFKYNETQY
jgi:hypothetical protein